MCKTGCFTSTDEHCWEPSGWRMQVALYVAQRQTPCHVNTRTRVAARSLCIDYHSTPPVSNYSLFSVLCMGLLSVEAYTPASIVCHVGTCSDDHNDAMLTAWRHQVFISAWPVVPAVLMQCHLFRVVLDVIALELDELVEAKFAQCLSLSRVLPANPCKILSMLAKKCNHHLVNLTGAG